MPKISVLIPVFNAERYVSKALQSIANQTFADFECIIINAVAEGINNNIMSIKRRAGGYRNIENFKKAILFYCSGLDLYPR